MVAVREQIDGREVDFSSGGLDNEGVVRKYVRRFQVELDTWSTLTTPKGQDLIDAVLAPGIPRIGDPFTTGRHTDLGARCSSVRPIATAEPRFVNITCEYSNNPRDFGVPTREVGNAANEPAQNGQPSSNENQKTDPNNPQAAESDDPLSRPPEISWGEETYTERVEKTTLVTDINAGADGLKDDQPVANSAGEEFDPGLEIDMSRLTLTIVRNQAKFDHEKMQGFFGKLNSDTFFNFASGMVRCKSITAQNSYEKGKEFWRATYSFVIRDDWDYQILDAGYWDLSGAGAKKKEIQLENGRPTPVPFPLDGNGIALTDAQVAARTNFKYRRFRVFTYRSFSQLRLP